MNYCVIGIHKLTKYDWNISYCAQIIIRSKESIQIKGLQEVSSGSAQFVFESEQFKSIGDSSS